jgi:hypothetical protein
MDDALLGATRLGPHYCLTCAAVRAQVCKSGKNTKTSAGVLISADGGRSWEGHAVLVHSHSWLIENTLVEVSERGHGRKHSLLACLAMSSLELLGLGHRRYTAAIAG